MPVSPVSRPALSAAEEALVEVQLEAASLYDDLDRITAEFEITEAAVRGLGLAVRSALLLACGPTRHHRDLFLGRRPHARLLAVDISLAFVAMARRGLDGRAGSCRLAVGDMRALAAADGSFDLVGLYGNSFGFFDHAGNLAALGEIRRCLRPGGVAVITVPRFAHAASFTAESPLLWRESAATSCGVLEGFGERSFDPARGCSVGRYELYNRTTGERSVHTGIESRVYPFASGDPATPCLADMAAQTGFADAALRPIADERTRHAKGLMEKMDCLVLVR